MIFSILTELPDCNASALKNVVIYRLNIFWLFCSKSYQKIRFVSSTDSTAAWMTLKKFLYCINSLVLVTSKVRIKNPSTFTFYTGRKFSHLIWIKKEEINKCEKYPIWNPHKHALWVHFSGTASGKFRMTIEHFVTVTGTWASWFFNCSNVHIDRT